jgi:putative transposase
MDYRYGSHTVFQIEYILCGLQNIVIKFSDSNYPKRREQRLCAYLESAPPNLAPSEIMRGIKGRISSYLF